MSRVPLDLRLTCAPSGLGRRTRERPKPAYADLSPSSRLAKLCGPGEEECTTSQGRPYSIFCRALEHGNLLVAEATAKELHPLNLTDALELTMLIARKDSSRYPRVAARWLSRFLEEHPDATIEDAGWQRPVYRPSWLRLPGGSANTRGLAETATKATAGKRRSLSAGSAGDRHDIDLPVSEVEILVDALA